MLLRMLPTDSGVTNKFLDTMLERRGVELTDQYPLGDLEKVSFQGLWKGFFALDDPLEKILL